MSSHAIQAGSWCIDGRDLDLVAAALKLAADSARSSTRPDAHRTAAEYDRLLADALDAAFGTCAPQAAQVAREALVPEWQPKDLIPIKEAAGLMGSTESNVRQMTNRKPPTLWSVPVAGVKMVSRAECLTKRKRGA